MSHQPGTAMGIDLSPKPLARRKSAAPMDHIQKAARFVISPAGHTDDRRLQAAFKLLRREAPVHWVEVPGIRPFWLITRHADISSVERRGANFIAGPRPFLSNQMAEARLRRITGTPYIIRGLLQMDQPEHGAYRGVVQASFTPAAITALEASITLWANQVVDRLVSQTGVFDFAEDVAVPFSLRIILRMMGLPEKDEQTILLLSRGLVGAEDPERRLAKDPTESLLRAGLGFRAYFDPVTADRRACPRHDLSGTIANATIDGQHMPDHERLSYFMMIATGGHDTISFSLSGGLHALITHPDQLARLRSNPDLLDTAVEEILRWTSPGRHLVRTATADTDLGDKHIRAGDSVALFFNSANRDETVFAHADQFRIDRQPNPHIAFGLGPHVCIGSHLARIELRTLFKALLPRLASAELMGPPARTGSTIVTGISSLPIRCTWNEAAT